jgi:undecaprenyl-diphosphatase
VSILEAIILGIIQGLTEFFPVSSDGHLVLVPFIAGWDQPTLAFIVATHIGTFAALVRVFWEDVARLITTVFRWREARADDRKLLTLLVVGSIPAAIVGFLLESRFEAAAERPVLAAFLLGAMGMALMSTETKVAAREQPNERTSEDIVVRDSAIIGTAQVAALLPGISRSGMTIIAGLRLGLTRPAATRFSFLLSIPIIFGAIVFQLKDMISEGASVGFGVFAVGIVASAVAGWWAIRTFLRLVQTKTLRPFGAYLMFAMVAGLLTALARG